ncbi:MAG: HAD-IA family hydrolase [Candidatus Lokiarchaeota archaeon]
MELKEILAQKKILVFDLDGTIVKLKVDWNKLKSLLDKRFSHLYEETCEFDSISACLSFIVSKDDKEELLNFIDIIRDFELKNIEATEVIPESVYFIKHPEKFGITKDAKFSILSLNTRETIKRSLILAKILDRFEIIIGREDVRRWKPEPEGLIKIKRHFKVKDEEIVYFGDQQKDIITGKNANIIAFNITKLKAFVRNSTTQSQLKLK